MPEPFAVLAFGASEVLGRPLTNPEIVQFHKYLDLLIKWQRTVRLVGRLTPSWIVENLFLDSLLFLRVLPAQFAALVDIGAGAGIPGIPIKIVRPGTTLVLIESRRRRASFLSAAVRDLQLEGAEVINARAEDVVDSYAGRFDAVVMRCAGSMKKLLPVASRFGKRDGLVVASGPPTGHAPTKGEPGWTEVSGIRGVRSGARRLFRVLPCRT